MSKKTMAKFELFIANRFNREERDNKSMSRPAVRIAIIGITLGLAVMLISIAVIVGFKDKPFGKRKKDWTSEKDQIARLELFAGNGFAKLKLM